MLLLGIWHDLARRQQFAVYYNHYLHRWPIEILTLSWEAGIILPRDHSLPLTIAISVMSTSSGLSKHTN